MIRTKLWLAQRQLTSSSPQKRLQAVQTLRSLKDTGAMAVLHCVQRSDGAILGVFLAPKNDEADPEELSRLLAEFQSLALADGGAETGAQ